VFQQNDADHYELISNVPSGIGIRTGYFFAKCDRFYVGVPGKRKRACANLDIRSRRLVNTGRALPGPSAHVRDVGLPKTHPLVIPSPRSVAACYNFHRPVILRDLRSGSKFWQARDRSRIAIRWFGAALPLHLGVDLKAPSRAVLRRDGISCQLRSLFLSDVSSRSAKMSRKFPGFVA
jgi:hypothetical protein